MSDIIFDPAPFVHAGLSLPIQVYPFSTHVQTAEVIIAIDPGTEHFGVAYQRDCSGYAVQCDFPHAPDRIENRLVEIAGLLYGMSDQIFHHVGQGRAFIEAAAYSRGRGEAGLGMMRGMCFAILYQGFRAKRVTLAHIQTVRKAVLGDGKKKAHARWPHLKPDAAAALSILIYGRDYYGRL
jgi:hypothetical protein